LVVPGTEFELFERDGIVFYNDPGSERAGVVRVDGTFSEVDKYDPDRPGAGLGPEAGRGQAPAPDLAAPGQGEGTDDGALGGPDQGGDPDSGPSGGQQGPTPRPPAPGITAPGIPDLGNTDPGTTDPGTGTGPPVPARGIDFEVDQTAADVDEEVRFTAYATGPDDRLSDVSWQFSRNDAPAGEDSGNPLDHSFADPGEYLVTVQGTLRSGSEPPRTESMVHSFKVLDPTEDLVADFRASTTTAVTGQPVDFTNLSTGATRYSWSFEGARTPDTSPPRTPPHQFSDPAAPTRAPRRGRAGTSPGSTARTSPSTSRCPSSRSSAPSPPPRRDRTTP